MEFINRSIYASLKASLKEKYITVLLGPRQTGKSTLLKRLMADLKDENTAASDILSLNFDDPTLRAKIVKRPQSFFEDLEANFGEPLDKLSAKKYLFLDEAQKAPQIFDLIKIIYDQCGEKVKAVITGSSSLNLLKKSAETLAGRLRLYHLSSLSWGEIAANPHGSASGPLPLRPSFL